MEKVTFIRTWLEKQIFQNLDRPGDTGRRNKRMSICLHVVYGSKEIVQKSVPKNVMPSTSGGRDVSFYPIAAIFRNPFISFWVITDFTEGMLLVKHAKRAKMYNPSFGRWFPQLKKLMPKKRSDGTN